MARQQRSAHEGPQKMLFTGKYIHSIDDKGRVVLPASIRKRFEGADTVIISPGVDGQLAINRPDDFEAYLAREEAKSMNATTRRLVRFLANSAVEQTLDKAGRVVINEELRNLADLRLNSEVAVAGSYKQAEVWSLERYTRDRERAVADAEKKRARDQEDEEVAGS